LMCQDIGDGSGVLAWAAGAAVADVSHSGRGSGVFDEDLALQVGDGDLVAGLVAVGDDVLTQLNAALGEDVLEAVLGADQVLDLVQVEDAVGGQRLDDGVVGQVCRYRRGGGSGAGWRDGGSGHGWGVAPRSSRWLPRRSGV
jgi:hypothetical protein